MTSRTLNMSRLPIRPAGWFMAKSSWVNRLACATRLSVSGPAKTLIQWQRVLLLHSCQR